MYQGLGFIRRLPNETLQASVPLEMSTPPPFSLTGTVLVLLGISILIAAVGVLVWYRTR